MKTLRLSNKKFLSFIFYFILMLPSIAEDQTIDIWKINELDNEKTSDNKKTINEEVNSEGEVEKKNQYL